MLKKDVRIGGHYAIAHTSYNRFSVVRIDSESIYGGWNATKLSTNRRIRIKTAAKLRFEVTQAPEWTPGTAARKWVRA